MSESDAANHVAAQAPSAGPTANIADASSEPRAGNSPAAWSRFLIPAILGVTGDLMLKAWSFPDGVPAVPEMPAGRHPAAIFDAFGQPISQAPSVVIPHILGFTTTVNHGAVFGFGQGKVMLFLAFSMVALAVIVWVFLTSPRRQWMVHLALGLIMAGAIGNMFDRAVYHGVRDMLKFYVDWYPYIFNGADVLLCIGVPVLIFRWLFIKDSPPISAK